MKYSNRKDGLNKVHNSTGQHTVLQQTAIPLCSIAEGEFVNWRTCIIS